MITYRCAEIKDIEIITDLRIEVLRAANLFDDSVYMEDVRKNTLEHYKKAFEDNSNITYLALDNNKIIACGSVSFYSVMPTYCNKSGKCAYLMNIYTKPEYRKQGIATAILDYLVKKSVEYGAEKISLEATAMGRPIYEKYGFKPMKNEMELL